MYLINDLEEIKNAIWIYLCNKIINQETNEQYIAYGIIGVAEYLNKPKGSVKHYVHQGKWKNYKIIKIN